MDGIRPKPTIPFRNYLRNLYVQSRWSHDTLFTNALPFSSTENAKDGSGSEMGLLPPSGLAVATERRVKR